MRVCVCMCECVCVSVFVSACGKEKKNKNNMNSRPQSASRECGGERRNYYGRRNVLRFRFSINYTQARAYI